MCVCGGGGGGGWGWGNQRLFSVARFGRPKPSLKLDLNKRGFVFVFVGKITPLVLMDEYVIERTETKAS